MELEHKEVKKEYLKDLEEARGLLREGGLSEKERMKMALKAKEYTSYVEVSTGGSSGLRMREGNGKGGRTELR